MGLKKEIENKELHTTESCSSHNKTLDSIHISSRFNWFEKN